MAGWTDIAYNYIMDAAQIVTGYYFLNRFPGKKISGRCPAAPVYFLFTLTGIMLTGMCPGGSIQEFIVYILLLSAGGFMLCGKKDVHILVYAFLVLLVQFLCSGISNSLSCILSPFVFTLNPAVAGYIFMWACGLLSVALSFLCYTVIERYFINNVQYNIKDILIISVPVLFLFFISGCTSHRIFGNTVTVDASGRVLLDRPLYQILFIQVLGAASLFCILYAYKMAAETYLLSREVSLLENEAYLLKKYAEEAKERYDRTKSFRHDVKNHVTVLRRLIQDRCFDTALKYTSSMEELTENMSFPASTNNPVADILIGRALALAESKNIVSGCSLVLPCPCPVNDIDLCIVFSNALDNAVSACDRMGKGTYKFIQISGNIQGSFLFVQISNSYNRKETVHIGTGIANIKEAAEKYNGSMDIETADGIFTLSVLFILPQHPGCIPQQKD